MTQQVSDYLPGHKRDVAEYRETLRDCRRYRLDLIDRAKKRPTGADKSDLHQRIAWYLQVEKLAGEELADLLQERRTARNAMAESELADLLAMA